jgi:hypothetical protein
MSAHVFYFLAGQNGESAAHPNVFSIKNTSAEGTKLGDVLKFFPLSGSFHFRFKTKVKDYGFVWMDVNNPDSIVPKFGSSIFAKVLQLDKVRYSGVSRGRMEAGRAALGSSSSSSSPTQSKRRTSSKASHSSKPTHTNQSRQRPQSTSTQKKSGQKQQQTRPRKNSPSSSTSSSTSASSTNSNTSSPTVTNSPTPTKTRPQRSDSDDFFSFNNSATTDQPITDSLPSIAASDVQDAVGRLATNTNRVHTKHLDMSDMSDTVKNKILERQAKEQARIDTKLARHLLEAEQKEKDQVERDKVKANLKDKLIKWSGDPKFGTLKNVRAMLATMDSILWEGAKWKTVGMGDLVQPNRVKIAYYKAIRIAHPDRVQTGTVEEKYIASWVLDMLKISWENFKNKEM